MHSKDLYSNSKVIKKPKNQRKSSKDLIKKIIPKSASGSYDLNPFLNETNYAQNNRRQSENKHEDNHQPTRKENETFTSDAMTNTTTNTTNLSSSNRQSESSSSNFKAKSIMKNSYTSALSANIEFPKKRTCLGFPILCFAYFAAIYTLVIIYFNFD